MQFRKDINGLRAISVLAVVLYHYNSLWLPGGFVGVDIFFVISGFLMTGIIFSGLESNSFSVIKFYESRAKRIVPALAVLCIAVLVFGWFYLIPLELEDLAKHSGSSMGFFSNFVYLSEVGYFDVSAHQKWLLHTWSLSVEWQFYLVYPLLLLAMSRFLSLKALKNAVLVMAFIGYIYSAVITQRSPDSSYYLLPARAWEMLLGGVAFLFPLELSDWKRRVLEWSGLVLIIASFFLISSEFAWPGYLSLIPVLGAFLLIQANRKGSIITNNISFQFIGKWSYSIYLWHWPLIVLDAKYALNLNFGVYLLITILCALISYQFIERKSNNSSLIFLFLLSISVSLYLYLSSGAPDRVDEKYQLSRTEFHVSYYGGSGFATNKVIYINSTGDDFDFFFAGDSYGLQYAQTLEDFGESIAGLFDHGCLIIPGYSRFLANQEDLSCSEEYAKLQSRLLGNEKPLLIANSWDAYQHLLVRKGGKKNLKLSKEEYYELLSMELGLLFQENGIDRQYFILGVPQRTGIDAFECLSRTQLLGHRLLNKCDVTQKRERMAINDHLSEISHLYENVTFIDPNDFLCTDEECLLVINREPIHTDKSHLSIYATPLVVEGFIGRMSEVLN